MTSQGDHTLLTSIQWSVSGSVDMLWSDSPHQEARGITRVICTQPYRFHDRKNTKKVNFLNQSCSSTSEHKGRQLWLMCPSINLSQRFTEDRLLRFIRKMEYVDICPSLGLFLKGKHCWSDLFLAFSLLIYMESSSSWQVRIVLRERSMLDSASVSGIPGLPGKAWMCSESPMAGVSVFAKWDVEETSLGFWASGLV